MKCSSIVFCASIVASVLVLGARTSHAQSAWRCDGEDCQDALISDIETLSMTGWPASQTIAMLALPYTCTAVTDVCPHCAIGEPPGSGDTAEQAETAVHPLGSFTIHGNLPWSVVLSGSLRSLLIGRFTASADVFGTIQASPDNSVWPSTDASYVFQDACDANGQNCTFVTTTSGGSTGVVDLGPLSFAPNISGSFWNSSLTFRFTVNSPDIVKSCTVGSLPATSNGSNTFTVSYPVALTSAANVIAEVVRNQFRQAARIAVTGSP